MTHTLLASTALLILHSCNPKTSDNINHEDDSNKIFAVEPAAILKDYSSLYNYIYYNAPLSQSFIGLDTDSTPIDKTAFLNSLINDNKIPLKIRLYKGQPVYRLYKPGDNNKDIIAASKDVATVEMANFKMEGQNVPAFNFADIDNINYDANLIKGKILVLKCWYIACTACVKEFPECNDLADEYADRSDILFISLAFDNKEKLKDFLTQRTFKYSVIPEMKTFMQDSLATTRYPTHFLISKNGKIAKVVNSLEELKPFLKKEAGM